MIPAISKKGDLVYEYGKAHLFGMFEEEKFFAPGNLLTHLIWTEYVAALPSVMIYGSRNFTGIWPCRAPG